MITYKVQRITEPEVEPITPALAKEHLRIESSFTFDDDLITAYISAAREQAEKYCNRSFAQADFYLMLRRFPAGDLPITLPDPQTSDVASVTYVDGTGAEQTVAVSDYIVDATRQQIRPTGNWPTVADSVLVRYTAGPDGSASPAEKPPRSVEQAMLLIIADMYEMRTTQVAGTIITQNPAAAMRLSLHRVEMGV